VQDPRTSRRRAAAGSPRRRRQTTYSSVSGPRPDRVAAWAVGLSLFLVIVAGATARADTGGADLSETGAAALQPPGSGKKAEGMARITWYGPGFYGRRTACGVRLRRATAGVAHRRLPCGTRVILYAKGRTVTVRVIDRGPYARGVEWDLTAATARALSLSGRTPARVAYARLP
jgi:rare lipoprotein A (peptidoglycan hydrolase)